MAASDVRQEPQRPLSLLQSLQTCFRIWLEILHTRLDLFSTELEEEKNHLQGVLILAVTSLFCLMFGALLVTLLVVAAFWETDYRLIVLGALALLYLAAGAIVAVIARRKTRNRTKLFAASLGELAKDYRHLSS